jgi:hypothetical protein
MEDFANAIAYEVKQEIADRYFGFRTRIETQSKEYLAKLRETGQDLDSRIQLDLCRMQFLLQEPRLFCSFLKLVNLPRDFAMRLTTRQSLPKVQELFFTMKGQGFTRWRRFCGLAIAIYLSLAESIETYHNTFLLLQEDHAEICMEIEKFQRQNDLSDILCFLRNLDALDAERKNFLHSHPTLQSNRALEQDLRIAPPAPVTEVMLWLNILPPLKQIKGQFIELLKEAYSQHDCSGIANLPF